LKRILIIGGSDAGVSAALRAREVYPIAGITIAVADKYPSFSVCGLPFYVSGEAPEWSTLAYRSAEEIEKMGIRLLLEHRAKHIDLGAQTVNFLDKTGRTRMLPYDRLILATGAASTRPSLSGTDLPGVFFLRWMDDALAMERYIAKHRPKSAIIIGSGYMGLEMADALTRRGLSVTMLVRSGKVLKTIDPRLQEIVRAELVRNGVKLIDRIDMTGIEEQEGGPAVRNAQRVEVKGDLILLATGSRPETDLASAAGIPIGVQGGIRVNRAMETGLNGIYAAGDCVEAWHRLLKKNVYPPLGTTAHKQGRVAGENAAGGHAQFVGTLGTQAVKIFDIVVARTGLRDSEAREAGFDPTTAEVEAWDHKAYSPGATPMRIRITGDRKTRQLLGAQIVGHYKAEVSKRIDVFAAAISAEMSVDDMIDLDLSYSPPLSGTWDPVQAAAMEWTRGSTMNRAPLLHPGLNFLREDKAVTAEQSYLSCKTQKRLAFAG
jgi:NADPH-dependent 2,4-dienoyl-CoA reductase/sulfur reductase-like enzyme